MADGYVAYVWRRLTPVEMVRRGREYFELMDRRRTVREFAPEPVGQELIEWAIRTASTAPSGAHRQPWRFVAVSDPVMKKRIRDAAEKEELAFYEGERKNEKWIEALSPLGTNVNKEFLETAPWLVVVFEEQYGINPDGTKRTNYYGVKSVGIACGMFIAAVHNMGLATVPYTPSPMSFLGELLGRKKNERPYIVFPVGYPAENVKVPDLKRKELDEVSDWVI